jgi:hypothetical protein
VSATNISGSSFLIIGVWGGIFGVRYRIFSNRSRGFYFITGFPTRLIQYSRYYRLVKNTIGDLLLLENNNYMVP